MAGDWQLKTAGRRCIEEKGSAVEPCVGMSRTVAGGTHHQLEFGAIEASTRRDFYVAQPERKRRRLDFQLAAGSASEWVVVKHRHTTII